MNRYAKHFSKKDAPIVTKLIAVEALLADIHDDMLKMPASKVEKLSALRAYLHLVTCDLDELTEGIKSQFMKHYSHTDWDNMITKVLEKLK